MVKPYITPEQIDEASDLREQGKSIGQIARRLDLPETTIDYHLRKNGVFPPGWKHQGALADRRKTYTDCRGRTVRPFTRKEDAALLRLDAEGVTYAEMGRRIKRPTNSCRNRLISLANRAQCAEGV